MSRDGRLYAPGAGSGLPVGQSGPAGRRRPHVFGPGGPLPGRLRPVVYHPATYSPALVRLLPGGDPGGPGQRGCPGAGGPASPVRGLAAPPRAPRGYRPGHGPGRGDRLAGEPFWPGDFEWRRSQNLNVRGAWLHIFGDALGSVGVIVAAGLIGLFGWYAADPIAGAVIAVLILISAFRLIRDAVEILMEAVPRHIDLLEVRDTLRQQPGVADVHDLHIWTLASGFVALSAHVVTPYVQGEDIRRLLVNLRQLLHDRYGISHTTLQLETPSIPEDDTRFCQGDPRCLP
ncbi:MAG: hypothetical protein C4315_07300 [Chloroflexota bacterium]